MSRCLGGGPDPGHGQQMQLPPTGYPEVRLGQEVPPTWLDVLSHNGDMAVPVGPCVLVPEADDMAQLMDHDAELITVLADGDGLGAPTTATHVGAAPGGRGQLRGAVPSWGSASTQGPGQAARLAGEWRGGGGP